MIEIKPLLGLRMINDGSVSLISTRLEEKTNVATLSWQMPLSQEPPMVGIALTPSSLSHHFLKLTGEFVLSIPDASLVAEVHYCGTHQGRDYDKIRLMELRTLRAYKVSPLLIANCLGHLECVVRDWNSLGDHIFYTAEVVAALVELDYFEDGWNESAQTLHHVGGDFYRVGGNLLQASKFPLPIQRAPQPGLFEPEPSRRFALDD
jgi:flavin reductase (DIM6/NTAB) family NADH-FMN oxidoreductase RutF